MDPTIDPSDLRIKVIDTAKVLHDQSPFADLKIEYHSRLGGLEDAEKVAYVDFLKQIIDEDGSHAVIGVYAMGNIKSRPENSLIIVGDLEIIVNVSSDMVQIMEHNATHNALHFVRDMIIQLGEVMVFASGKKIIDTLGDLGHDRRSDNIVFSHTNIDMKRLENIAEDHHFVDVSDPTSSSYSKDEIKAYTMLVWGYEPSKVMNLDVPHIIMVNEKDEVMGGARANEISHGFGVVGGVITLKPFRKQGVGTAVSQIITAKLLDMGLQPVLETDDENIPALKIYEKLGYERVGETVFLDFGTDMISQIRGDRDY